CPHPHRRAQPALDQHLLRSRQPAQPDRPAGPHHQPSVRRRRQSDKTIFPPAEPGQPATETVFHYDYANRLQRTVDALGGERSTAYDRAGNRIEEVDESGKTTTYGYDRFNRLATITDGNANVTRYVYPDPNGDLTHAGDLYQPIRID